MKVNRVILASDNNPLYYSFWNNLSKTYKEKFNINPTLVFFGTEEELKTANLSEEYGNIFLEKKIDDIPLWQYTWALFYYTKFYLNDVCAVMGIDQIPLGTYFLKDIINNVDEDQYVMLIDNQYTLENKYPLKWDQGGFSPSAYHIAKGSTFNDIYNFEDTFEKEIKKIDSLNVPTMWEEKWGTDEGYSSKVLREYHDRKRISDLSASEQFLNRRIDCHRYYEVPYDINLLNSNYFIECHACRPYEDHKQYLDNLFNSIPKIKNYFSHETSIVESDNIGEDTKIWAFSHICKGSVIGKNCVIGEGVYIGPKVIIGDNCKIQNNSLIYEGVILEDNVFLGPNTVTTNDHKPKVDGDWKNSDRFRTTLFKKGCSIGANSVIVCGVTIGENSLVGAGSVITKNIPPNSTAYGNPAKIKK
jgi:UDP-2-acetamido-3-amino-2,3-dideoxy-glucuronate N-acetyltransferase